ncbi:MAG: hypothetical protein ABI718_17075 [Acidobacteriota bacterium]
MESYWAEASGDELWQGDLLLGCQVPRATDDWSDGQKMIVDTYDLIVATQTCEIEQKKVTVVSTCPVWTVEYFEKANPSIKGKWNEVLKGRRQGLHMLSSYVEASNNRMALVVDFHLVFSLPYAYLQKHAVALGHRPRLRSPWLEDFSQAFARYFMRVALPSRIPNF